MARAAQPSDLESPVPGADEQAEIPVVPKIEQIAVAEQEQVPVATVPSEVDPSDMGMINELAASGFDPATGVAPEVEPADEAVFQQLAADQQFLEEHAASSGFEQANAGEETPLGFGQELKARLIQGVGRNVNEETSLLSKALGGEFEVRSRDEDVFFRKKGSKKWFPIDRPAFQGGFREVLGDLVDLSGIGVEVAGSVAGEAGAIAAGTAVAGPAGTVGGALAGIPTAAAISTLAREGAVKYFEGQTSTDLAEEFAWGTALNAATLGLGALVKGAMKKGLKSVTEAVESAPKTRIDQLAHIRQSFDEFVGDAGLRKPGATVADIGESVHDAVSTLNKSMNEDLDLVKNQALVKAGKSMLPTESYTKQLSSTLEKLGISQEQQQLLLTGPLKMHSTVSKLLDASGKQVKSSVDDLVQNPRQEILNSIKKLHGDDSMIPFVDALMNEFQVVNKQGGLTMEELLNRMRMWKKPSGYRPDGTKIIFPAETQALSRQLYGTLTTDRVSNIQQLFKDTPEAGEFINSTIKGYSEKIDSVKKFRKIFAKKDNVEKFMNALVQPENSHQVKQLKEVLGAESSEFAQVQAAWVDRVFNNVTDSKTGVVNGKAINDTLNKFGKLTVDEIVSPAQRHTLEFIASKAEKIPYMDILGNKQNEQFIKDGATAIATNFYNPALITRVLWRFIQGNAEAAQYLKDGGLQMVLANKKTWDKTNQVKVLNMFNRLLDATDVMPGAGGKKALRKMDFEKEIENPEIRKIMMENYQKLNPERSFPPAPGAFSFGASSGLKQLGEPGKQEQQKGQ